MTRVATHTCEQKMTRLQQTSNNEEQNHRVVDRILARTFLREVVRRRLRQSARPPGSGSYQPRMDLCDDAANSHIIATLELPGLKQEDISVRIENSLLVVQGERRFRSLAQASTPPPPLTASEPSALVTASEGPSLPRGYTTQEIKYGMFRKTLELPLGTQTRDIQASLADGMLTISWPRNPHASPVADNASQAERSPSALSSDED